MFRVLLLQLAACSLCLAYPYIIVPASFRSSIGKRAFDRVDMSDFGFDKRAFDRLDGGAGDFGLDKRSGKAIVKRAFDRLETADFGLRRKRAFDRIARSEFGFRRKRSFDRLGGHEFGLMKRSSPSQAALDQHEFLREELIDELSHTIALLNQESSRPIVVMDEEDQLE